MTNDLKELRKKSKMPAAQAGGTVVADFFQSNKKAMAAVLPKHVQADRLMRIALSALRNTPKLMECTTESLMGAVMQLAQLGLEPNTLLGHAYLVPFNNKKARRTDVQIILGYKGLIDLARRSGHIVSLSAHEVRENDEFKFAYGLEDTLEHVPAMNNGGSVIAFYAVAKLTGGGHVFEVLSREMVDQIMRKSQSKGEYGPWRDFYVEMGRKTVIRRLFKYLPSSIEIATASAIDEVGEVGGDQHLETALEGEYSVLPEDYSIDDPEDDEEEEPEVYTDANGEVWNQEIHATGHDGKPRFNTDGTFRARRGVRAAAASAPAPGVTFAQVSEMLNQATDQDELDDAASYISSLPENQQGDIKNLLDHVTQKLAGKPA